MLSIEAPCPFVKKQAEEKITNLYKRLQALLLSRILVKSYEKCERIQPVPVSNIHGISESSGCSTNDSRTTSIYQNNHVKNTVLFIIAMHRIDCPLMMVLAKFKYSAVFHLCCARF